MRTLFNALIIFASCCWISSCREEYTPPAITTDYNYLIVEGSIIIGRDSSFFKLSRTQPPASNTANDVERNATIQVLGSNGNVLAQSVEKGNGQYAIFNGPLTGDQPYQVKIRTASGHEYLSDQIVPKITAPIDSVSWERVDEGKGIQFSVSTHDPSGKSRYYRWENEETWEYHAFYESYLMFEPPASLVTRPEAFQINKCWQSRKGTEINIATSAAYIEDFIIKSPVYYIAKGTDKLNWRHSLLVTQHAISAEAFEYWQNLKKMTEQGGTIFDVQPSELIGNIHCITNPAEPTIGFISANTVTQKRIFVDRLEVTDFVIGNQLPCDLQGVQGTPLGIVSAFAGGNLIPIAWGIGSAPPPVEAATRDCADCTFYGGTTVKPSFW